MNACIYECVFLSCLDVLDVKIILFQLEKEHKVKVLVGFLKVYYWLSQSSSLLLKQLLLFLMQFIQITLKENTEGIQ